MTLDYVNIQMCFNGFGILFHKFYPYTCQSICHLSGFLLQKGLTFTDSAYILTEAIT